MGEQARFLEHKLRHGGEIIERAGEAEPVQEFARLGKNPLRLVAEAEKRFLAARAAARFGNGQDFVRAHIGGAPRHRIGAKGAIAAIVAAEMRQRDEDLLRIADDPALDAIPQS